MEESDIFSIHQENLAQGYHSDLSVYQSYFLQQSNGKILVFAAVSMGALAGYVLLRPQAEEGPFACQNIPELADFNVFQRYRRREIEGKLFNTAQTPPNSSAQSFPLAWASTQAMKPPGGCNGKRGYLPDGSGLWYQGRPLAPYTPCCNDDALILY